jgi:glycerol-3-phosphate O-acyltransferase
VFIPVGINYDRTLEDRSLLAERDPRARGKSLPYVLGTAFRFLLGNLYRMARGRWYRFGYACVNFGSPVSMMEYCRSRGIDFRSMEREERFRRVEALARDLMAEVGRIIPVLPVSLVATAFLRNADHRFSGLEVKAEVLRLIRVLSGAGARVHIPRKDQDYAVDVGLRMLTLRRMVIEEDGLFRAKKEEIPLLRYYSNSIGHLLRGSNSIPTESMKP